MEIGCEYDIDFNAKWFNVKKMVIVVKLFK